MPNEIKWKLLYTFLCDIKHKMSIINDAEEGNNDKAKEMADYINNGIKNIMEC